MIPIYEQGSGRGIGYSQESFAKRLISICDEHISSERAKNFAFIFRKFDDENLNNILRNEGVFTQLDRMSGKDISIFYLDYSALHRTQEFNEQFLDLLGFPRPDSLPCVVFFKLRNGVISGQEIAYLDSSNLMTAFHELYILIERHIGDVPVEAAPAFNALRIVTKGGQAVLTEVFKATIEAMVTRLFGP